uniref:Uncharacterized protein AlNc14C220G9088 n=1 Tax=Albugo laibachii Nc14 TaxID=890382 RepID=F0WRU3_9STRA|nr:conserved hypothetical protein [Albugo laibachii Nc14]|eukprot:CCA24059.1 conserved hypothetical protein [Albugo laibachii Nc14]
MNSQSSVKNNEPINPRSQTAPNIQPTLKVMRLYKPKLYSHSTNNTGVTLPTALSSMNAYQQEYVISNMLCLPDSFGQIFLGNTFSSYISVINPYNCDIEEVGLTANIQCGNDRVELQDNRQSRTGKLPPPNPTPVLSANSSLDMVVDFPLSQVGNHVLRVGVSYLDPITKESKSLRKFYRFGVQNPLILNFKQSRAPSQEILIEAQIRNVSSLPLFIDSIRFEATSSFTLMTTKRSSESSPADCTQPQPEDSDYTIDTIWPSLKQHLARGSPTLLQPQEELQRMFRLFEYERKKIVDPGFQSSQTLGRLHVGWKTSVGEAGSVQSQPIVRKYDTMRDVSIRLHSFPERLVVEKVFVVECTIENHSTRNFDIQLQFRKESLDGIVCYCLTHQHVGSLVSEASITLPLKLLPLECGLQEIRDIVCVDLRTGQEFFQQHPVQLMVYTTTVKEA